MIQLDDALVENIIEPGHKGRRFRLLHRIPVAAGIRKLLDDPKILDVPGNGSLGTAEAVFLQSRQQLLLGFNVFLTDDLQYFCLTLTFHCHHP